MGVTCTDECVRDVRCQVNAVNALYAAYLHSGGIQTGHDGDFFLMRNATRAFFPAGRVIYRSTRVSPSGMD